MLRLIVAISSFVYCGLAAPYHLRFRRDFVPPNGLARPAPPDPLQSPHVDPNNPYLESLADPAYPSYGFGLGYQNPVILGGSANFPTGNVFHPTENLNGTFGYSRLLNVRFGTQGGPIYPWQDPRYAGSAKYMALLQYQQSQQRAMMTEALKQQSAASAPTDPFGGAGGGGGGGGGGGALTVPSQPSAGNGQVEPFLLATPPPLPSRFRLF